jgi:hypothetical protein
MLRKGARDRSDERSGTISQKHEQCIQIDELNARIYVIIEAMNEPREMVIKTRELSKLP